MDGRRFDDLTRVMAARSRRAVVAGLAGGALAAVFAWRGGGEVAAACRRVGEPCGRDEQCCFGRCEDGLCPAGACRRVSEPCDRDEQCCFGPCEDGLCPAGRCRRGGESCRRVEYCCHGLCEDDGRCPCRAGRARVGGACCPVDRIYAECPKRYRCHDNRNYCCAGEDVAPSFCCPGRRACGDVCCVPGDRCDRNNSCRYDDEGPNGGGVFVRIRRAPGY